MTILYKARVTLYNVEAYSYSSPSKRLILFSYSHRQHNGIKHRESYCRKIQTKNQRNKCNFSNDYYIIRMFKVFVCPRLYQWSIRDMIDFRIPIFTQRQNNPDFKNHK